MKLEWKVWNMHEDWQPMTATTLEEAASFLETQMPYSEEAVIRIDGKKIMRWNPPRETIHWP